ncbi:putative bifunctional diguanylate cyclase/phosphodiesterase [Undibacterium sp. SXout11W]|uniref:putative bifunctional diguanylate cyclase/phosphodiesterase n=1 Tax=Undibacterium sp. SXout11W TaxID=3413050 RepID=UPI003BF3D157
MSGRSLRVGEPGLSGRLTMHLVSDLRDVDLGVSLSEAVFALQGVALDQQINHLIKNAFEDAHLSFERNCLQEEVCQNSLCCQVSADTFYLLSGKQGHYTESDLQKLNHIAGMTARLFALRTKLDQQHALSVREHMLQTQILDQIHESVIIMDLAGFILSWNRGAEKMFGYASHEVLGRNILFLYEDEEIDQNEDRDLLNAFLTNGAQEMEVRRRKKCGEVFWASLTLSVITGVDGQPAGIVGYLSDITHRKEAEKKINQLAYFDVLTNLPNRSLFKQLADQTLQIAQRKQVNAALLFVDLNRFKPINDMLGHRVGDALLSLVAQRLVQALRDQDTIARLGSDEFAIALPEIATHSDASAVAQKIIESLQEAFYVGGHELRISASIGVSIFPTDGRDAEALLQCADIAMYQAKKTGDSQIGGFAFYDQNINLHIAEKLFFESAIRKALLAEEFFLQYQPKIDIRTKRIISVEALLRWNHPRRGLIPPAGFIGVAEESGLIQQVDSWVLDAACKQAKRWQGQGVPMFKIAINLSAKDFTEALPAKIDAALKKHQISAQWLELEITESMLMQNVESVIFIMRQVVALGVSLALDDFGTGYSSLSYLKRFPISSLKIDRSFVQGIPDDANDCAIAGAIIMMAHQLKLNVVAEGVETQAQLDFLQNAGCNEIQGYLFSRPVEATEIPNLLNKPFFA